MVNPGGTSALCNIALRRNWRGHADEIFLYEQASHEHPCALFKSHFLAFFQACIFKSGGGGVGKVALSSISIPSGVPAGYAQVLDHDGAVTLSQLSLDHPHHQRKQLPLPEVSRLSPLASFTNMSY
ncbi:hypothetical protein SRHO_G00067570 [Serrasalmus rhombeus]